MGVDGKRPAAISAPRTSGPASTAAPVTGGCARGVPSPQPSPSRPATFRGAVHGSSVDVGLGVGRGGGWAGGGGASEALVGCIVRPTNPMTRDPAFVLALLRGEGVERWGWSVWG